MKLTRTILRRCFGWTDTDLKPTGAETFGAAMIGAAVFGLSIAVAGILLAIL